MVEYLSGGLPHDHGIDKSLGHDSQFLFLEPHKIRLLFQHLQDDMYLLVLGLQFLSLLSIFGLRDSEKLPVTRENHKDRSHFLIFLGNLPVQVSSSSNPEAEAALGCALAVHQHLDVLRCVAEAPVTTEVVLHLFSLGGQKKRRVTL